MRINTHVFYLITYVRVSSFEPFFLFLCFVLHLSCSGSVSATSSTTKNSCGCSIPGIQILVAPTVFFHAVGAAKLLTALKAQNFDWPDNRNDVGFQLHKRHAKMTYSTCWPLVICLLVWICTHLIIDSDHERVSGDSRKIKGHCRHNLRISGITLSQTCPWTICTFPTNPKTHLAKTLPSVGGFFCHPSGKLMKVGSKLSQFSPTDSRLRGFTFFERIFTFSVFLGDEIWQEFFSPFSILPWFLWNVTSEGCVLP